MFDKLKKKAKISVDSTPRTYTAQDLFEAATNNDYEGVLSALPDVT